MPNPVFGDGWGHWRRTCKFQAKFYIVSFFLESFCIFPWNFFSHILFIVLVNTKKYTKNVFSRTWFLLKLENYMVINHILDKFTYILLLIFLLTHISEYFSVNCATIWQLILAHWQNTGVVTIICIFQYFNFIELWKK